MYGLWGAERGFALLVGSGCWLTKTCYWVVFRQKLLQGGILTKTETNRIKTVGAYKSLYKIQIAKF